MGELKKTQFYVQTASGWLPIYEMPIVDFGEELEDVPSLWRDEISFTVPADSLGYFAWWCKWEVQKSIPKISRK